MYVLPQMMRLARLNAAFLTIIVPHNVLIQVRAE